MLVYVELLPQSWQFAKCRITMHFHNTHASLTINRVEEYKRTRLKVEEGVRLALEARWRAKEKEEHTRLEAEEEARIAEI